MKTILNIAILLAVLFLSDNVSGHGRLYEPPGRCVMWRFGFETPQNYNDNELFCGGFDRQYNLNGGKCGYCGDPYDAPQPRENEEGGLYGLGIISRTYRKGQIIDVVIDLTANHIGYFEFRLCLNNDPTHLTTQECLDENVLNLADGSGTKFFLEPEITGFFQVQVHLPANLVCSRCVLQWHYESGNNWGMCEDGSNQPGCGPQETFRGCADIAITP